MTMYIVVSVGNTDNKLTQQEWHAFVSEINQEAQQCGKVHFFGAPPNWMPWQNAAWIIELRNSVLDFSTRITNIRKKYNQDSAFILFGEGAFV